MTDPTADAPETAPETAPQAEAAPDPVAVLAKEAADLKDRLLRTLAEMENLRRRTEREVADSRVYAVTNFARGSRVAWLVALPALGAGLVSHWSWPADLAASMLTAR